jgi:hypothetical protein
MPKIETNGWIDSNDKNKESTNIPKQCPRCGKKLSHTDSLSLCNWYFVYCNDLRCRWADIYYM